MRLEIRKYMEDIRQASELLVRFTEGKRFEDYNSDPLLRSGVERQFEIAGEALNQLAQKDLAAAEKISDYRRIVAFRNRLIHGYHAVDDRVVWDIIERHLPTLRRDVEALLQE